MLAVVDIDNPLQYNVVPLVLLFLLLLISMLLYLLRNKIREFFKQRKENKKVIKYKNIYVIKSKYLSQLMELNSKFNNNQISVRKAYQDLSIIIRTFIKEATNIDLTTCTLQDIKEYNVPVLYELIRDYYDPEFNKVSKGNFRRSLDMTKGVIERWH